MGTQVPLGGRGRDSEPVFSAVAPEIIEDTLIHLATENEQYLSELPEQAGCFKETRIVGYNGCLLPAKPLLQLCVQLLDLCYLTRETIYDTLLKITIENSTPSKLQIAKFLTVKEDFMLLAVGVISTGVFILSSGHWEQVQSLLKALAPREHRAKVVYLWWLQHSNWAALGGDTSVF